MKGIDIDPPGIVRPAEDGLVALARRANEAHDAAEAAGRTSLEQARAAGEALLRAKEQLPHGRWLPWLAQHVAFSERTAQDYMRLARQPRSAVTADSLAGALRQIASERDPAPPPARPIPPPPPPPAAEPEETVDLDAAAAGALAALSAEQQLAVLRGNEERVARLASAQRQRDQADARRQRLSAIRRHLDTARRLAEGLGDEAEGLLGDLERAGGSLDDLEGAG